MSVPVLVPCLRRLRSEVNELCPDRSRTSDGWIGDPAHQARTSDHNNDEVGRVPIRDTDDDPEVHALDLDADLNHPTLTMDAIVRHILARCRAGQEPRLRYIIWQWQIWEASNGWAKRAYPGPNGHTQHAHFSSSYNTALEASTRPWLEELPIMLTTADKKWLSEEIDKAATRAAERVWKQKLDIDTSAEGTNLQEAGSILAYTSSEHHKAINNSAAAVKAIEEIKKALPTTTTPPPATDTKSVSAAKR